MQIPKPTTLGFAKHKARPSHLVVSLTFFWQKQIRLMLRYHPKKKSSTSNKEEVPSQLVLAIPRALALCAQIVFFLSIRAGFKKQDDSDLGMVIKIVALKVPFSQR